MLCYHIYNLKSLAQFNILSGIPTMLNIRSLLRQTHRFACFMMMLCFAGVSFAETPHVAADIAPVHSLVARVMDGVGTPSLIIAPGASPHEYSLRPSEAVFALLSPTLTLVVRLAGRQWGHRYPRARVGDGATGTALYRSRADVHDE